MCEQMTDAEVTMEVLTALDEIEPSLMSCDRISLHSRLSRKSTTEKLMPRRTRVSFMSMT